MRRLQHVDDHEQTQPNDVNEVPVPGCSFEGEMMFGIKMATHRAGQNHCQHDRTNGDVKPWKPVNMKNVEPKMPVESFRLSAAVRMHVP